jgi:hypothetical protein
LRQQAPECEAYHFVIIGYKDLHSGSFVLVLMSKGVQHGGSFASAFEKVIEFAERVMQSHRFTASLRAIAPHR